MKLLTQAHPLTARRAVLSAALISLMMAAGDAQATLITAEAESGTLGANLVAGDDGGVIYISNVSNNTSLSGPELPGRVARYNIAFPEAGTYDLYARVRVGPGDADDDSFFYANGFGTKSPTAETDWIRVNSVNTGGFTAPNDEVTGSGSAGNNVWKWLNLSEYTGAAGESPITFTVPAGNLNQTFQIGGREDGFDMDKFAFGTAGTAFTVAELDNGSNSPPVVEPRDLVAGNLIQFNDNGCWTWYVDERTLMDTNANRLIVGCVENGNGVGGVARDGNISATFFDLQSRTISKTTLKYALTSYGGGDDHNAPGMAILPGGKYLAFYTGHNSDQHSYYSIYDPATGWGPDTAYDWSTQPGGDDFNTSYSHPYHLSAEGITYDFARGNGKSPNFIYSTDLGVSWNYGGMLTTNNNVGYVNGYFKFWGNGKDRIDFLCTEYHPRDFNNSIYHGYISNHMSFRTDGTVMDSNIFDKADLPHPQDFTQVFAAGTVMPAGQTNYRCWNDDLCRYADGTITCIISTRLNNNVNGSDASINPDHAFFYCRYNGTNWSHTYLCKAGTKLYSTEADYVGLGSAVPNDPNTIYISTTYDPRDDTPLGHHEIWKGVSPDDGASFEWTQITRDSDQENFRPIVPAWDANNTALIWFRGTYTSAQILNVAIVGLIDRKSETVGQMTYEDATTSNTTFTNDSPLVTGTGAGQWHEQTGSGNGGSVLTSSDAAIENAPMLKTHVTLPASDTYDVWLNFWGKPGADWRIVSGLSATNTQLFRQMACKEVEAGDHATSLVLSNSNGAFLYQAYLGRTTSDSFDVFVDDNNILTGTTNTAASDSVRTWYDGVSYARVAGSFEPPLITQTSYLASDPGNGGNPTFTLEWQSGPNATYSVLRKRSLEDAAWTVLTNSLASEGDSTSFTDNTVGKESSAFYRISSP